MTCVPCLDNGIEHLLSYTPYWLTDKHETSEEAGQELGSGTQEHDLGFDPAGKVDLVPETAGLRKPPPNKLVDGAGP